MEATLTVFQPNKTISAKIEVPDLDARAAPGETYICEKSFNTIAGVSYTPGDKFMVVKRTYKMTHDRMCSIGNVVVRCKHFESTWSCFDNAIHDGLVKKAMT